MMDYVVAKKFKTTNRRFETIGETIRESDVDSRISFDQWKERGFVVARDSADHDGSRDRAAAKPAAQAAKVETIKKDSE